MIQRMFQWLESSGRSSVLLLLTIGAALRLGWLADRGDLGSAMGEVFSVASAFAQKGEIADAFGPGSGLSTHFTPVLPIIAGTVYRLFGVGSSASEMTLAVMSIGLTLTTGALLYRAFGLMGTPRLARLAALGLFCILPIHIHLEAMQFRIWEGALATALGAGTLVMVLQADQGRWTSRVHIAGLAILAAFLFFVSPPMGLAAYFCSGLVAIRRVPIKRWIEIGAIASIALVVVMAPWTIRNYQAFGEFIPLRSNFGLELALANHPAAATGANDRAVFTARMKEIHPLASKEAFAKMRDAGNERAYSRALGKEARAWIADNPLVFVKLSVIRLVRYYFLPAWIWTADSDARQAGSIKAAASWLICFVGLLGAFYAIFFWHGGYSYAAIFAIVPSLPYALVHPILRYRYLVFAVLLFLGIELISRAMKAAMDKQDRQVA